MNIFKAISPQLVVMVLRILNTCVFWSVSFLGSFYSFKLVDWSLFYFWALQLIFLFFSSSFPVPTLGLDQFLGAYLNKLQFLCCPLLRTAQSNGSTRLGASLPQNGNRGSFRNVVLYKIRWSPQKKIVSINFSYALFPRLDFLTEDGTNQLS
jgi:hypothetical protein